MMKMEMVSGEISDAKAYFQCPNIKCTFREVWKRAWNTDQDDIKPEKCICCGEFLLELHDHGGICDQCSEVF